MLKKHHITSISSLIFDEIRFNLDDIRYEINVLIDTSIKNFVDNNFYILKDGTYFFLVHLNECNTTKPLEKKILVKPIDTKYRPFRINTNEISIFGKILYMSSFMKSLIN